MSKTTITFLGLSMFLLTEYANGAGYFVSENTKVYAEPKAGAAIVGEISPGVSPIGDDQEMQKLAPAGWVAIEGIYGNNYPSGWVPRSQLAGKEDFKKVIDCWPISVSRATDGEAPWDVTFKMNGEAVMTSGNDPKRIGHKGHVFKAGNVVLILGINKGKDGSGIFGQGYDELPFVYDSVAARLRPLQGDYDADTIYFPKNEMGNCRDIRTVR
jgi:hypothetical protein